MWVSTVLEITENILQFAINSHLRARYVINPPSCNLNGRKSRPVVEQERKLGIQQTS